MYLCLCLLLYDWPIVQHLCILPILSSASSPSLRSSSVRPTVINIYILSWDLDSLLMLSHAIYSTPVEQWAKFGNICLWFDLHSYSHLFEQCFLYLTVAGCLHHEIGTSKGCASYQACTISDIGIGWSVCSTWFKSSVTNSGKFCFLNFKVVFTYVALQLVQKYETINKKERKMCFKRVYWGKKILV